MEMIALIMSGLALLAATISLTLNIREKKRSEKQRVADLVEKAKAYEEELKYKNAVSEEIGKLAKRADDLESGIVPDFEEAKSAARAVDDFNRGLSNILGFDPLKVAKNSHKQDQYSGEDE